MTIGALSPAAEVVVWSCVLIVLVVIGGAIVLYLRARFGPDRRPEPQAAISLETVEQLHQAGQISDEEFARLRRSALGLDDKIAKAANSKSSLSPANDDENNASRNG